MIFNDLIGEVWKSVPGCDNRHQVSNCGRTRSVCSGHWKLMTQQVNHKGYLKTRFGVPRTKRFYVHQLVLLAFVGEPPPNHEVAHNNGVRTDNRLENLRWATRKDNQADRVLHGTTHRGESSPRAKLSNHVASEIYSQRGKVTQTQAALAFGVSRQTISDIFRGRRWKHITGAVTP